MFDIRTIIAFAARELGVRVLAIIPVIIVVNKLYVLTCKCRLLYNERPILYAMILCDIIVGLSQDCPLKTEYHVKEIRDPDWN